MAERTFRQKEGQAPEAGQALAGGRGAVAGGSREAQTDDRVARGIQGSEVVIEPSGSWQAQPDDRGGTCTYNGRSRRQDLQGALKALAPVWGVEGSEVVLLTGRGGEGQPGRRGQSVVRCRLRTRTCWSPSRGETMIGALREGSSSLLEPIERGADDKESLPRTRPAKKWRGLGQSKRGIRLVRVGGNIHPPAVARDGASALRRATRKRAATSRRMGTQHTPKCAWLFHALLCMTVAYEDATKNPEHPQAPSVRTENGAMNSCVLPTLPVCVPCKTMCVRACVVRALVIRSRQGRTSGRGQIVGQGGIENG